MSDSKHDRIREMVDNAFHDSVTADRLDGDIVTPAGTDLLNRTKSDTKTKSIYSYLLEGEQPHFILTSKREAPSIYGPEAPSPLSRPRLHQIVHVVTDRRWLMIAGHSGQHQRLEIPLADIEATNYDTESRLSARIPSNITNNRYILKTNGAYYEIPISNSFDEEDLLDLGRYLRKAVGATPRSVPLDPDEAGYTIGGKDRYSTDQATLTTLIDELPESAKPEADEIIQDVDSPDVLVQELARLIREHEDENPTKSLDDRVTEAQSIDELRDGLKTPVERKLDEVKSATSDGVDEVKHMLREADPQEFSRWAGSAARVTIPFIRYGTPGFVASSAAILGAGVAGAYADTHENTLLDDIDPIELARHAEAMAGIGEELEEIDGQLVGALLGASKYLGQTFTPEEYAHWVTQADPEAVLLGAENAAAFAREQTSTKGQSGAVYGSGIGLIAGYSMSSEQSDEALRAVLDDDLFQEYLDSQNS